MIKNLKKKWGIHSPVKLFLVLLVFSITGSVTALIAKPILNFFGLHLTVFGLLWYHKLFYWICYVILLFPIYQILLLSIGFLFGQFHFFWQFEKKTLSKLGLGFLFQESPKI